MTAPHQHSKSPTTAKSTHPERWQPIWSQIPAHVVSLEDYEIAARQHLPIEMQAMLFENHLTHIDANAAALDRKQWLPKVLSPALPDMRCHLYNPNSAVPLDITLPHPLWLSPVAHHGFYHPLGEYATLEAANLLQTPCIFSSMGNTPFAKLLPAAQMPTAVQWYWQPLPNSALTTDTHSACQIQARRNYNLQLIHDVIAQGMTMLVITVDAPHTGVRAVSRRFGARIPSYCQTVNLPEPVDNNKAPINDNHPSSLAQLLAQAATWADIEWLVSRCPVPVFLKGILHPEDAQRAKDIGCAGIIASNHGRRAIADISAVADCMASLRAKVGDELIIIADGGVRSGSDMAKLMALGADAVGIGRGYIYGLALAGALGVAHVNKLLLDELEVTMALLGANNLTALRAVELV